MSPLLVYDSMWSCQGHDFMKPSYQLTASPLVTKEVHTNHIQYCPVVSQITPDENLFFYYGIAFR